MVRAQLNRVLAVCALVLVLPLVAIAERRRAGHGRSLARRAVCLTGRMCGVHFRVHRSSEFDESRPYILVPNHSSLLDIAALLVACPSVQFVATAGLFRIPLLAAAMRAFDTIPLARHDPTAAKQQMAEIAQRQAQSDSSSKLVVFAEGGIAPQGQRLPFKSGAFYLAVQTGLAVVPVAIHHAGDVLPPRHRLALRPGTVTVELLAPILTEGLEIEDRHALRDQVREIVVDALKCDSL